MTDILRTSQNWIAGSRVSVASKKCVEDAGVTLKIVGGVSNTCEYAYMDSLTAHARHVLLSLTHGAAAWNK